MNKILQYIFGIVMVLYFSSCARYGTPGGGPDDKTPPQIDISNSDSNYQLNFNKKSIVVSFDEWINLSNPVKEIVISPPLNHLPQISSKGKSVIIDFAEEEKFKEDATYQINFGNAIKDFTAGNILKNFVFVFSTGNVIDSLSMGGKVLDELTGKPASNVLVLLYESLNDSSILTERPFYFTRTDNKGTFDLQNIRNDTFLIYALVDENVSYNYDLPNEKIAFYDRLIFSDDTINNDITLMLFDEEDDPRLEDYSHEFHGLIKVKYDHLPMNFVVGCIDNEAEFYSEVVLDSIYIWHKSSRTDSVQFEITYDGISDTLGYKSAKKKLTDVALSMKSVRSTFMRFHPSDSIVIEWNKPIQKIDTSLILMKDSADQHVTIASGYTNGNLWIDSDFENSFKYNLQFLPGALTDWYNISNTDTFDIVAESYDKDAFGSINIQLSGIADKDYIIELKEKEKTIRTTIMKTDGKLVFEKLLPAKYKIKIIEDSNRDGRWTSGSLMNKTKSEKVKEESLEELKLGWDLELDLNINQLFDGT